MDMLSLTPPRARQLRPALPYLGHPCPRPRAVLPLPRRGRGTFVSLGNCVLRGPTSGIHALVREVHSNGS